MKPHDDSSNSLKVPCPAVGEAERGGAVGPGELFPLPLVPFERYMLADDRRGYPMTFFVRVEFAGTPDQTALDAAFAEALGRHPLLTSRIARRGLRWHWVPADGPPLQLQWHTSPSEPAWPIALPIDLRRGAGIRAHVHAFAGRCSLVVSFHHAACDGIGAFRFIGDLLACYGRRTAPADALPALLPIRPVNLRHRGQFDLRGSEPVSRWVAFQSAIRESCKVLGRRPQRLLNSQRPPADARRGGPRLPVEHLSSEIYRRFCARAEALGVTGNDLLLRDMFLAICEWNEFHAKGRSRGWLRITMPTSLRGKRDAGMPATNSLGYALVTRHTEECSDPDQLLAAIAADTRAVRKWSLGAMFVDSLSAVGRVPGLLWLATRLGRRFSTLVLSNLGDVGRRFRARFPHCDGEIVAGNLTLKSVVGAPPIRPGTRAAVAVANGSDGLSLTLNYDPRWFSAQDASDFLARYVTRLKRSAETSGD